MNSARADIWPEADPGVVVGDRPDGTVTLADLAATPGVVALADRLRPLTDTRRVAVITAIHYALAVVTNVLVGPAVLDGRSIEAVPSELGFVPDGDGAVAAVWIGAVRSTQLGVAGVAQAAGRSARELMLPVIAAARNAAPIAFAGAWRITLDAISGSSARYVRLVEDPLAADRAQHLIRSFAGGKVPKVQTLTAVPDAGPPVTVPVPTVCCVLSSTPTCHSCPTCPLHPRESRVAIFEEFLRSLDDDGFRYVTGRHRVDHA